MIPPTSGAVGRAGDAVADAAGAAATPRAKTPPSASARAAAAAADAVGAGPHPTLARAVHAVIASIIRGRSAVSGYATDSGVKRASNGSLSFLRDPTLSIEEKLMRLLAHLSEKWEKEMQSKLDEMAGAEGARKPSSSKSGVLKKVTGAVSKAFGGTGVGDALASVLKLPGVRTALGKLGGPVLAAAASALGFPAAAPLLARYGGTILGAAADATSSLGAPGSSEAAGKGISDAKRQQLTLEIQRLYEKQKEMFGLVSNILRVSHETRSAVIGNIR